MINIDYFVGIILDNIKLVEDYEVFIVFSFYKFLFNISHMQMKTFKTNTM